MNRIPLMQAQTNYKISEFQLRNQLINLINNAENAYWNVISARETLRVKEKARDTADTYMKYMQQQLDLGALSPLDIYNPKAALAAAEVDVSQAKFNLAQTEDMLRKQIGADLDPDVRKLPVVLTETVDLGASESLAVDPETAVQKALTINPAVLQAAQKLDYDDLGIQSAKNGLLPNLSLTASYTSNGQGGIYYPGSSLIGGEPALPIPGGLMDALGQMFGFGYPTYRAGLTLTLPIRNRAASAAMANALVSKKSDSLNLRTQQQSVRLNVLNAITALEGSKESLKLAIVQRDFSQKNADAMMEKYRLGAETNQNVVFAQRDLANAESAVVNAQVTVRKSLLNLITQTGELLDVRGIVIK